jgi:hypothetical protein
MKKITAIADLKEGGKLLILKEKEFKDALKISLPGRYFLTLEKAYKKRSTKQNSAMWAIPYRVLQDCFSKEWGKRISLTFVHEFCKNPENRIIPEEYIERIKDEWDNYPANKIVNKNTGEVITIPFVPTTTKMRTVEMMEYYANLQNFLMEWFGADCPDPDPNWKDEIEDEIQSEL